MKSFLTKLINHLPLPFFVLSITMISYVYGTISHRFNWFPNSLVSSVYEELRELKDSLSVYDTWVYVSIEKKRKSIIGNLEKVQPGLTKITGFGAEGILAAKIIDPQGNDVHTWNVDWFEVWPDAIHLSELDVPRSRPGTTLHGSIVTDDGGLIFNYEKMGLVRLDACSNVVWRLPRRTHHSLYIDDNQHLWVPDLYVHEDVVEPWASHKAPFTEFKILEVSLEGEVLQELSVMDLIQDNGLSGLFYMQTAGKTKIEVGGDTLHLNDIEVFPVSMKEGVFSKGDIMISLRNLNAIMVFNPNNKKLKYLSIGKYIRQHDPDFIDGNTISVYDNNNLSDVKPEPYSRIALESALDGTVSEYYAGKTDDRFFTPVLGKHQWLDNGNVLITVAAEGRVIEVAPDKNIVWDYYHVISKDFIGAISGAERLPDKYNQQFFQKAVTECGQVTI